MSATTRRSFILTDDGDLDTSTGTLQFASGLVAMKQAVRSSILLFLGEWFLDTSKGTPWKQKIFLKNPNISFIKSALRDRILGVAGIKSLADLQVDYARSSRSLTVTFSAVCDFGVFDDSISLG